jgi:ABC-2 type transport system permease protein
MASLVDANSGRPAGLTPPSMGWLIVAEQELRDLWMGTHGLIMVLAFSVLVSVLTYLAATNTELYFLDQKDTLKLVMQVSVGVGVALTILLAADTVSGERERRTLESLLLTPVSSQQIAMGKLVAALSIWVAVLVASFFYAWILRVGPKAFFDAIGSGALVGTLLAVAFACLGLIISIFSGANRVSMVVSAFVFIAMLAPCQLPGGATKGWLGEFLVRINPVASGARFIDKVIVANHGWGQETTWLVAPVMAFLLGLVVAVILSGRLQLHPGFGR